MKKKRNILSLFANIGLAEAFLEEMGFHVAIPTNYWIENVNYIKQYTQIPK